MPMTLSQKLQIKPGTSLYLINAPDLYRAWLEGEGVQVAPDSPGAASGAVLVFVKSLDEARRLATQAIAAAGPQGLLWFAYPKGGSGVATDVNRDKLWHALESTGWRPVRQVALDDIWSGMRFRPADAVINSTLK